MSILHISSLQAPFYVLVPFIPPICLYANGAKLSLLLLHFSLVESAYTYNVYTFYSSSYPVLFLLYHICWLTQTLRAPHLSSSVRPVLLLITPRNRLYIFFIFVPFYLFFCYLPVCVLPHVWVLYECFCLFWRNIYDTQHICISDVFRCRLDLFWLRRDRVSHCIYIVYCHKVVAYGIKFSVPLFILLLRLYVSIHGYINIYTSHNLVLYILYIYTAASA